MSVATLWQNPLRLSAALLGLGLGLIVARIPLLAVALLIAAVILAVVLTRPELVLLAMVAAQPWENMLHYPSASLSTVKGIGAAVMLAFLVRLCSDRRTIIHLPRALAIVTALGVWIGVTLILSSDPSAGLQKFARWALFLAFFFLVIQLVDGRREVERVLRCLTASVAAAGVYSLWLFLGAKNGYRAAGPLEDPNDLAYLMACTLPIAAYLIKVDPRRRSLWGASFVVITGAMLATFSRGALVGLGALIIWGIFTRRIPLRAVLAGLLIGVALIAIAFTAWKPLFEVALEQKEHVAQSNVESREARWDAAVQLAGESPLIGVGTGLYPSKALPLLRQYSDNLPSVNLRQTVAHNSYLEIMAENGIPGLALFVAYLITIWILLRSVHRGAVYKKDERGRWLATALQASFVIAIVSAIFLSEELYPPFWLLGGLAVVLARDNARGPTRAAPASTESPSGSTESLA